MTSTSERSAEEKRVLFLAYLFPPTGGAGVQRSLKFVKYLGRFGWKPTVLTVKPISYYVYDASLLEEVPQGVEVVRSGSLDPLRVSAILLRDSRRARQGGVVRHPVYDQASLPTRLYRLARDYTMFPDAQIAWIPFALARGLRAIRRERPRVIYTPAVPYSSTVVARLLSAMTGIPYVVDFRDPWTDDKHQTFPTALHRRGHRGLERSIVTGAAGVVVYGDWLARRLVERYPEIEGRVVEITNGFDPADGEGIVPRPATPGKHRLVHSGSLYPRQRPVMLTFLKVLAGLAPEERERLEVVFVGQVYPEAAADVEEAGLAETVRFLGYRPHGEALSWLASAGGTLLFLTAGDRASISGKVFELLMIGKPILAAVEPEGEAARVLRTAGLGSWIAAPDDADGLGRHLGALLADGFRAPAGADIDAFSRVRQTEALGKVFDRAAAGRSLPRMGGAPAPLSAG